MRTKNSENSRGSQARDSQGRFTSNSNSQRGSSHSSSTRGSSSQHETRGRKSSK